MTPTPHLLLSQINTRPTTPTYTHAIDKPRNNPSFPRASNDNNSTGRLCPRKKKKKKAAARTANYANRIESNRLNRRRQQKQARRGWHRDCDDEAAVPPYGCRQAASSTLLVCPQEGKKKKTLPTPSKSIYRFRGREAGGGGEADKTRQDGLLYRSRAAKSVRSRAAKSRSFVRFTPSHKKHMVYRLHTIQPRSEFQSVKSKIR